jgi:hypothetical protein
MNAPGFLELVVIKIGIVPKIADARYGHSRHSRKLPTQSEYLKVGEPQRLWQWQAAMIQAFRNAASSFDVLAFDGLVTRISSP